MLHLLHSEFPLLWVIVFFPWAAFIPERTFSYYFCIKHPKRNWCRNCTAGPTCLTQAEKKKISQKNVAKESHKKRYKVRNINFGLGHQCSQTISVVQVLHFNIYTF